jgi:hypothetical protein
VAPAVVTAVYEVSAVAADNIVLAAFSVEKIAGSAVHRVAAVEALPPFVTPVASQRIGVVAANHMIDRRRARLGAVGSYLFAECLAERAVDGPAGEAFNAMAGAAIS